jgi:DNA gyrase/topoisomerase IV subunit B
VEQGRLQILETPLVSTGDKAKKYYFSLDDFKKSPQREMKNVRYLKGLGSLSLEDWDFVMKNRRILEIVSDSHSRNILEMAFGKSSQARKRWLSSM